MTTPIAGMDKPTYPYGVPGDLWLAGFHTGQDYAAASGTPVRATKSGTVVGTGNVWGTSYGRHQVIIESRTIFGRLVRHGYMHMRIHTVMVGQKVKAGVVVGQVGEEGNTTGPHLHYEERYYPFRYDNVCRRPLFPNLGPYFSSLFGAAKVRPNRLDGGGI